MPKIGTDCTSFDGDMYLTSDVREIARFQTRVRSTATVNCVYRLRLDFFAAPVHLTHGWIIATLYQKRYLFIIKAQAGSGWVQFIIML